MSIYTNSKTYYFLSNNWSAVCTAVCWHLCFSTEQNGISPFSGSNYYCTGTIYTDPCRDGI